MCNESIDSKLVPHRIHGKHIERKQDIANIMRAREAEKLQMKMRIREPECKQIESEERQANWFVL